MSGAMRWPSRRATRPRGGDPHAEPVVARGPSAGTGLYPASMEMTPARWDFTCRYLHEVFGREDDQLAGLMPRAIAAGLPDIAVSADVGRLLLVLTRMAGAEGRGASRALEVGTLAGYSAIWIARGLAPGGRLTTVEIEPRHAGFARREFAAAGVAGRIDLRLGAALEVLPQLAAEWGPGSLDLAFIDAVKSEYTAYARLIKPLLRPGGLLIADNVLGSRGWMDMTPEEYPDRDAVDTFNRMMAADGDFDAAAVPIRQGILIARKRA